MDLSSIYPDESGSIFDSMVEGMDSLFVVKTNNTGKLAQQLATYHSFTGKVAYHWHSQSGIKRFDLAHITLPKTNQLIDAIYHISNTQHFGIFLFTGFERELLSPMIKNVLEHFIDSARKNRKFIIFADENPMIPSDIADKFQSLTIKSLEPTKEPPIRTSYLYS